MFLRSVRRLGNNSAWVAILMLSMVVHGKVLLDGFPENVVLDEYQKLLDGGWDLSMAKLLTLGSSGSSQCSQCETSQGYHCH